MAKHGNKGRTKVVTIRTVLRKRMFRLGFEDSRSGKGFRAEYETANANEQAAYERGRHFAAAHPDIASLKDGGSVRAEAVWAADDDIRSRAII